jgi:diaminopimelate decarboxylase
MKLPYERPTLRKLTAGPLSKVGPRAGARPLAELDGVPVPELLARFGSPLFVLSERQLRRSYQAVQRAFGTRYPQVQLAWSYKTNYLNAVCRVFHQEGAWAEVVSGLELEKALANGVPGSQIIFNGPGKTTADLARAAEVEAFIHLDNFDELHRLLAVATDRPHRPRVALRVNLDAGIFPQWDRFGFNLENGEAWQALTERSVRTRSRLGLQLGGQGCSPAEPPGFVRRELPKGSSRTPPRLYFSIQATLRAAVTPRSGRIDP